MEKQIFTTRVTTFGVISQCVELPENVLDAVQKAGLKRVKVTIGSTVLHVAIMKTVGVRPFFLLSKAMMKKLKIGLHTEFEVILEEDLSEFQAPFPEELVEVLATDEEAERLFMALTDGRKRSLIYLIEPLKSTEKRIERALLIMEKLKMGISDPQLILKKEG